MDNITDTDVSFVFESLNGQKITITKLLADISICILGFFALSLNAIVLDTLIKRTSLQPTNLVMCHLAASDMLTGVLMLCTFVYNMVYFQNTIECVIRLGALFMFVNTSILHLALLTVDRFLTIVYPFRYHQLITRLSVSIISGVIWLFSVNVGLLPAYGWRNIPPPQEPPCSFVSILTKDYLRFGLYLVLFPVIVIFVLYTKIFFVARRHVRAIAATNVQGGQETHRFRFTKTVVILIGTYVLCFLPIAIVTMMFTLGGLKGMSAARVGEYVVYASVPIFFNAVINPVIYAFKLPPVKARLLGFFRKTGSQTSADDAAGQRSGQALY